MLSLDPFATGNTPVCGCPVCDCPRSSEKSFPSLVSEGLMTSLLDI